VCCITIANSGGGSTGGSSTDGGGGGSRGGSSNGGSSGSTIQPDCSTSCTVQEGYLECTSQRCLLTGPTCYSWGDPHYRTFDMKSFDFQGDCEYVLSQPCDSDEFIITGTNTAKIDFVSITSAVRVMYRETEVYLTEGSDGVMITINGELLLENGDGLMYHSGGVRVYKTGGHPYILLSIGIGVYWDGSRVDITVATVWQGHLCGLCGNYNNNETDDFMLPNGTLTASSNEFGGAWLYANTTPTCGELQPIPVCEDSVMSEAESRCAELTSGDFSMCNSVVDPVSFVEGCKLDYCSCSAEDREECYCNSLSAYVAVCALNGVVRSNWRDMFCRKFIVESSLINHIHLVTLAIRCPPGMKYDQCGPVCPQTCDTDTDEDCIGGCIAGCFCQNGQVLSNGFCIDRNDCQGK